jgi:hypothetical protein
MRRWCAVWAIRGRDLERRIFLGIR